MLRAKNGTWNILHENKRLEALGNTFTGEVHALKMMDTANGPGVLALLIADDLEYVALFGRLDGLRLMQIGPGPIRITVGETPSDTPGRSPRIDYYFSADRESRKWYGQLAPFEIIRDDKNKVDWQATYNQYRRRLMIGKGWQYAEIWQDERRRAHVLPAPADDDHQRQELGAPVGRFEQASPRNPDDLPAAFYEAE